MKFDPSNQTSNRRSVLRALQKYGTNFYICSKLYFETTASRKQCSSGRERLHHIEAAEFKSGELAPGIINSGIVSKESQESQLVSER